MIIYVAVKTVFRKPEKEVFITERNYGYQYLIQVVFIS